MSRVIQIVAFTIQPERLGEFEAIKARVAAEAHQLPGLLTSTTQQSLTTPHQFVDTMVWESAEACASGNEAFQRLPSTPAFLGLMTGPPAVADTFAWSAGDADLTLR